MPQQDSAFSKIIQIASSVLPSQRRKSSSASAKGKRRAMSFGASKSRNDSIASNDSSPSGTFVSGSPPVRGRMSLDAPPAPLNATSLVSATPLAQQGYPHIHIKEKIFANCKLSPKHSVEEHTHDCRCGKVVVERYREWVAVDTGECLKCKAEAELFEDF